MRTLEEARPSWADLEQIRDLQQLKEAVASSSESSAVNGQRSVCWKAFLLFETLDRSTWSTTLSDSRTAYISLRSHFLHAIEHPDEVDFALDPLSDNQESPWNALRADEALRAEIFQDVERCMPENVYFRQPDTQRMLLDILFIFCKLNTDVGYRQGMHEVVAPILWVVERDALDSTSFKKQNTGEQDAVMMNVLDQNHIEHDTFTLFGLVMQNAKSFYEQPAPNGSSSNSQGESPMLKRCRRIFEGYLPRVDPGLAVHLKKIDIVPQIFLMRWIRLIFGREFQFDDVLGVWDVLFAEDPSLDLVDLICVSMLLRIRWQLIEADTNTALTLLLHYPEPEPPHVPKTLVQDALYLKRHPNFDGGNHIVTKYTNRPIPLISRDTPTTRRPPGPNQLQTRVSGRSAHRIVSPTSAPPPPTKSPTTGIETILQDAARGVYTRGEKWGVNKAMRDAALSVRKNITDLQGVRNPPLVKFPGFLDPSSASDTESMLSKVETLELRNKTLSKMLQNAVAELWECQRERVENKVQDEKDAVERLSVAVAKVQFVQVYLEDSTIPLPPEEPERQSMDSARTGQSEPPKPTKSPVSAASSLPDQPKVSVSAPDDRPKSTGPIRSQSSSTAPITVPVRRRESRATNRTSVSPAVSSPSRVVPPSDSISASPSEASSSLKLARPSIAQSSFSWMLGQEESEKSAREAFGAGSRYVSSGMFENGAAANAQEKKEEEKKKNKVGKGFLFGEEEWEMG